MSKNIELIKAIVKITELQKKHRENARAIDLLNDVHSTFDKMKLNRNGFIALKKIREAITIIS